MAATSLYNSFKRKKYLKFADGTTDAAALIKQDKKNKFGNTMGVVGGLGTSIIDAADSGNRYGRQSTGSMAAKGALSGAAAGAALGPVGAVVGGALGAITGFIGGKKAKQEENRMLANERRADDLAASQYSALPSMYEGERNAQYMAKGGTLTKGWLSHQKAVGGSIIPKSSDGVELKGNSHEQGGIRIPRIKAELEGNETAKGDYVFSDKLGFAKMHKPLMVAKGRIEKKPATVERINTMKLLNAREEQLKATQDFINQNRLT